MGDLEIHVERHHQVNRLGLEELFEALGLRELMKENFTPLYEYVNNNTDDLYSTLVKAGACVDDYVFNLKEENYNITPAIMKYMKKDSPREWFKKQFATWDEKFTPRLTEIVTRRGIAFTFNMINASELLNLNE
jgi:hypothetical protein